jgi:hypothetical protein
MRSILIALVLMLSSTILIVFIWWNKNYSVDFNSIDFPPVSTQNKAFIDSVLKNDQEFYWRSFDKYLKAETNQKKYSPGEEVILTITNKTDKIEYFYPSDKESASILESLTINNAASVKAFEKAIVSKSDGILGSISYSDPSLVYLYLSGANVNVASKLGFNGFSESLKSGDKMIFQVKMPDRVGIYRILIGRFSHGSNRIGFWGANLFIISNTFEILQR